ncbi:diguanylate cyclase [Candidatus Accumulibacter sp. ACC007]|uniref:diguanylate cyclase n=1 Tax=Candidatus Accumulibacter sp. ACC007 TaxID=2823333 RepID=UPI0025BD86AB|nr:diguanylate cyclase [Candidatus Accumulibacter sp. ACC007]
MPNSPVQLPLVDLCADDAEVGRYAALLDSLGIGLLVFNADASLQLRNPQASSLLGNTETRWEDENGVALSADQRLEMQVLRTRQAVRKRTIGIKKEASAAATRCNASAFPVLAEDGSLRCVLLTLRDLGPPSTQAGEALQREAQDPLTRIYPQADIVQLLDDEGRRSTRYGTPFSLALIGIDHFPEFCRQRGAQAGERALAEVGRLLCAGLRNADMVGRFRVDQFLLILPNVRVHDATSGLERLRELVETRHANSAAEALTISGGVSEFTSEDSAALIERLRSLLAAARDAGGNRLCVNLDFF